MPYSVFFSNFDMNEDLSYTTPLLYIWENYNLLTLILKKKILIREYNIK